MTVSRGDRSPAAGLRGRLTLAAVALALIAADVVPLAAQETGPASQPLRLEPPRPQATAPAEEHPVAPPARGFFRPSPSDIPEAMTGGGVQVDQLGAVDQGSVGTLTASDGGFPLDMWRGTDLASVEGLIAGLPVDTESPGMRDIMRRLLLSRAATPAGESGSVPLVTLRVRALLAMGEAEAAIDLADAVPHPERSVAFDRLTSEASLIRGEYIAACRQVPRGVEESVDVGFWDKLLVLCQALAKETGKADLGLTILRDSGDVDPGYLSLVNAVLAGKPAKSPKIGEPTPLHVAAAATSGSRLPDDVAARASMPVLVAIALAEGVVSPEARVEAAERAVTAGAVDSERLRAAYRAFTFSDEERNNALGRAENMPGPRARALLHQAASSESVPSARAEILGMAAEVAERSGRASAMALANAPLFRQLPMSSDFLWLAPHTVRTMLRAGDHRTATSWFGLVRNAAQSDPEAGKTLARLAPLIEVGGRNSTVGGEAALGAWWDVHRDHEGGRAEAVVLGGVLAALGNRIPASFWSAVGDADPELLQGSAPEADPVAQIRLNATLAATRPAPGDAATTMVSSLSRVTRVEQPGRKGEIAVLALTLLGAPGPAERPVAVGQEAVAAFDAIGLDAAARQLALEILLSRGL